MAFKISKMPNLKIVKPGQPFWLMIGTQVAKSVRKRTEEKGVDAEGKTFDSYSGPYAKFRKKKGRSQKVNLSFTGKMLGALATGISATKNSAKVTLSGMQGAKAHYNELNGRVFMEISKEDANIIIKSVSRWVAHKNNLK